MDESPESWCHEFRSLGDVFCAGPFLMKEEGNEKLWKKLAAKQELKYIEIEFEQ